eukprot:2746523-Rhodomonas_salina.1
MGCGTVSHSEQRNQSRQSTNSGHSLPVRKRGCAALLRKHFHVRLLSLIAFPLCTIPAAFEFISGFTFRRTCPSAPLPRRGKDPSRAQVGLRRSRNGSRRCRQRQQHWRTR